MHYSLLIVWEGYVLTMAIEAIKLAHHNELELMLEASKMLK
jgi:hypothetical protein